MCVSVYSYINVFRLSYNVGRFICGFFARILFQFRVAVSVCFSGGVQNIMWMLDCAAVLKTSELCLLCLSVTNIFTEIRTLGVFVCGVL